MTEIDNIEIIGLVAAFLTTTSFVPQVYKTWKTKDVSGLSLPMFSMFFLGIVLWFVYGVYKESMSMIIANAVTIILAFILIVFKIKYDKKN